MKRLPLFSFLEAKILSGSQELIYIIKNRKKEREIKEITYKQARKKEILKSKTIEQKRRKKRKKKKRKKRKKA